MSQTFQIGDKVVRSANRYRVEGTVTGVFASGRVSVMWDKSQNGTTRIATGKNQSSTIKASSLVLASEFVARPLSKPTDEMPREVMGYRIDMDWHPSGQRCGEYGVNAFWFKDEVEAKEKFAELTAEHPTANVTLKRQDKVTWVPNGCRIARDKYEWHTLAGTI